MASETVENYLKAIHTLCGESPTGEAGVARLAAMLGITKGTATSMVKRLGESGLVKAERYGGITMTARGRRSALDILRRHRIVETFLVRTLKLDWSVVHAEAERLEHAISPAVLRALDAHLGHPAIDPHGDPIPDASGHTREPGGEPLSHSHPGSWVHIARITDQDPAFLSFVAGHGLKPGAAAAVVSVDPVGQALCVRARGHAPVSMSLAAAAKIICELTRR